MQLKINGDDAFVSTGGKAQFNSDAPLLLFIHGSGQSHLSWVLQGRFFANRGWQVLAPDLPGHGLSKGAPLTSITAMADWCAALLDAVPTAETPQAATVIGHSQGGLCSLELTRRHPDKVAKLALLACAMAIKVNDNLLNMAQNQEPDAIAAMLAWGHDKIARLHDHSMPGQSHTHFGKRMMGNNRKGALFADLSACAAYVDGAAAAAAVSCPTLCLLAGKDRMTPLPFGKQMAAAISDAQLEIIPEAGHLLTSEWPFATNAALRRFFSP